MSFDGYLMAVGFKLVKLVGVKNGIRFIGGGKSFICEYKRVR